jgi:branched-chain amino acid transport system permease protein
MESYLVAMLIFVGLYGLMALGLNITWGMAGMINLGLVGFFALGGYASALLTVKLHQPILVGLVAAVAFSSLCGAGMALITARLRGDYLAIVTLGFAEIVRLIASNEIWLTNGTDGISGIPGPMRGTVTPAEFNEIYVVIVAASVAVVLALAQNLRHSPLGRVLRAIRDDDQVAAIAGKRVIAFKIEAFAIGSGVLGLAGALYGHYTSYIAPDAFVPLLTIYIVLALSAGGTGNNYGALVGAVLIVAFQEGTRFVAGWIPGLAAVQIASLREIVISVVLILILRFRPEGIIPERLPRFLKS